MDARLQKLEAWGCDVKAGMNLAMGREALYIECLGDASTDESIEAMLEALKAQDLHMAFDASHTLKGMYANLGLTPLFNKCLEIVEPLRAGHCDNLLGKADELLELNEHFTAILQER